MGTVNKTPEGMGWRIAASTLAVFGSVIGIILWLFFYADIVNVYQNIAVVVAILLGFVAIMGATWSSWGIKQVQVSRLGKRDSESSEYE